jgi:hypothetical protein
VTSKLQIVRDGIELGWATEPEALELLRAGFLLPTDKFLREGETDWKSLGELDAGGAGKSTPTSIFKKVSAVGSTAASQAVRLTSKLTAAAKLSSEQVSKSTVQALDTFKPQIRKLVSRQLVDSSVARVRDAMQDDGFMQKVFGATYDCLPKPVCRFVSEEAFIKYCMERRQELFGPSAAEENTARTE